MFSTPLQIIINILISIFIIYAAHFFWNYLKDSLTVKKSKDIVNIQAEKYKKIVEDMQKNAAAITSTSPPTTNKPFENEGERLAMEHDLANFLALYPGASPPISDFPAPHPI
jgi:hypothetical protein